MPQLIWFITGCSSGFGAEFVRQILLRGDKVIATARNLSSIESLANLGAATLQLDVTSSQDAIDQVITHAISIYGHIDVLINNAGFVSSGSWEDLRYEDFLASFETNVFGPIKITRAVLPYLRQRKSGTMVLVSSLSGWIGHQFTGAYAGSKFALEDEFYHIFHPICHFCASINLYLGLVENLHKETEPLGLRTLLMEPGRFRTPLLSATNVKIKQSRIPDYEVASRTSGANLRNEDFKQPGNPEHFVRLVVDLVRQEGCAEGKKVPFHLPVGKDAVEEIGFKLQEVTGVMRGWDHIITNTDY